MTLDPELAALFEAGPPVPDMRITDLTSIRAASIAPTPADDSRASVERVLADNLEGWAYRPAGEAPRAVALLVHGGGWALGSPEHMDPLARQICHELPALVVSMRYRLAPESPAPRAVQEVIAALRALRTGPVLPEPAHHLPLVLIGDSAGGNLCAAASLALRGDPVARPEAQLLFYPAVDLRPDSALAASWRADRDPLLPVHNAAWSMQTYVADHDPADPFVSPACGAADGLPPTVIVTAGTDPLSDQGTAYAERLRSGGVAVRHLHEDDLCHGFAGFAPVVPRAAEAVSAALAALRGVVPQLT